MAIQFHIHLRDLKPHILAHFPARLSLRLRLGLPVIVVSDF
jgi:hypothetical protein